MAALACSLVGHRPAPRQYQLTAGATACTWECCPRCREHHRPDMQAALLVREVAEGAVLPAGYGVAWIRWSTGHAICLLVPLNVAAGAARRAWHWAKVPRALVMDPRQAYDKGYRAGVSAGRIK
jgi:hypothetical protein